MAISNTVVPKYNPGVSALGGKIALNPNGSIRPKTPGYVNPGVAGLGSSIALNPSGSIVPKSSYIPPAAPKVSSAPSVSAPSTPQLPPTPTTLPDTSASSVQPPAAQPPSLPQLQATTLSAPNPPTKGLLPNVQGSLNYGGLVGGLAGASQPSPVQQQALQRLLQSTGNNSAIGANAASLAKDYGDRIAQVGQLGAGAVAGDLSTGTNVVGSGNAAIASQSASQRMSALSEAEQAALAGTGQQLTAQNQLQSGLTNALGGANTQQATTLSGLNSAAGYAQPVQIGAGSVYTNPLTGGAIAGGPTQVPYGTQYINPATGQPVIPGVSGLDPQQNAQSLAQAVLSNRMSYPDAIASLGYISGGAGNQLLNNAIMQQNPNANLNQLIGQASAQQQNAATAGTAYTGAAAQGFSQALQTYNQANTAYKTADAQSQNLIQSMNGVNGLDSRFANSTINKLKNQFGDANYTQFLATLNETRQAYTNLLASVGAATPTVNGQQATDIFGEAATPNQIRAAIQALNAAAYAKLSPLYQQAQTYQSALQGGGGVSQGNQSSGGSVVHTSAGAVNTGW